MIRRFLFEGLKTPFYEPQIKVSPSTLWRHTRNGVLHPPLLNLDTRWKWLVSFTLRLSYPRIKIFLGASLGIWRREIPLAFPRNRTYDSPVVHSVLLLRYIWFLHLVALLFIRTFWSWWDLLHRVWIKLRAGVDLTTGCALCKVLNCTGTVLCVLYPVHKLRAQRRTITTTPDIHHWRIVGDQPIQRENPTVTTNCSEMSQ